MLVFHHPPLRYPAIPNVKRVVLQNIDDLEQIVGGTDVPRDADTSTSKSAGSLEECPLG